MARICRRCATGAGATDAVILTLNAGSSSLKFALFDHDRATLRGEVEEIGGTPKLKADAGGTLPALTGSSHEDVLPALLGWLATRAEIDAVGHRIVHGGDRFSGPARLDAGAIAAVEALVPMAPLHQPHALAAIRAVAAARPDLPQVGCFDTAFHRTLSPVARRIALPAFLGVRRYGFHGLSYEWIAGRLGPRSGRVIVAHLGSGASLCAMRDGVSVETTMGFSVLDGLVMGTRPGTLDPAVILYLMRARGMDPAAVEDLLYHHGGLLGVSGISADMRVLERSRDPAAAEARTLFAYRAAGEIGRLTVALGGLDRLVFTAGIGEHDAGARDEIAGLLDCLRPFTIEVIPADEEAVIARQTRATL